MDKKDSPNFDFVFGGFKKLPVVHRPGKLCTNVFDKEDQPKQQIPNCSNLVPPQYSSPYHPSKKSFRKYPREPGKLCTNVFDEEDESELEK